MFLRLEAAGVMLRVDRDHLPTMYKTPTLGTWELELLRSIERVVRQGHLRLVTRQELGFGVEHVAAGTVYRRPLTTLSPEQPFEQHSFG